MVRPHVRGRKRGRSKQQQSNDISLEEERPAKVAKKDITTTELKGPTTRASFHDNSLDGEHARGLTPPETAEKAGVASTNDTTTPRVTKHPPIHRQETTRRPCMVSPELTYVPDPPSFRMPHPTAAVSDDDKQKHHSRNKTRSQKETPVVTETTDARQDCQRGNEQATQNQERGLFSNVFVSLMEKSTALILLVWTAVIGVLCGPQPTREQSRESPSPTYKADGSTTTIWTRGRHFLRNYANVEHGIETKCRTQIQQSLSTTMETCRACTAAAKSNMTFAISAVKDSLTTRVSEFQMNSMHLSASNINHVPRIAPVCIVASLYMMFQSQRYTYTTSSNTNATGTMMWSTNVYMDHSISPATVKASRQSPIGFAYVTQQLKTLDQEASIEKKKKQKCTEKQVAEKEASSAKQEEEEDQLEPFVEPALEPTFQLSSGGKNMFDFKANPSPIGLAFVTQKLLEMDD
jgi:hypothetical protein